jgi:acyl-CoA hydrolase
MGDQSGKTVAQSQITLTQLMLPYHANALGNVHGGEVMKMVDETAAIAAMRHAGRPCVTVAIDSMTFRQPVKIGDLVSCTASLTYVGKSSIEVGVKVTAEEPISGKTTHTNSAYLVFVALDEQQRPTRVQGLVVETPEQERRFSEGLERQRHRLSRRQAKQSQP